MASSDGDVRPWRKSSYSQNNGACVELCDEGAVVAFRDSKDPQGGELTFSREQAARFIRGVASGVFGQP
ncbi:DUF397 domain-containing protein [Streptacidiphilus sp. P02-A3a]|uniref:DUF397 domain-containing protein n=1 Tax=Streptacidiphilus sp. P02-A3a TaxID=2704468 RepID=UPI0015F7896B|nr:DUF397 domain-containing protein [Streptacidiphilus sp. P02-A3a]QMU69349.1 DUF397 domain-containing protein [Streptacidiphilus sp. P02-A3a]